MSTVRPSSLVSTTSPTATLVEAGGSFLAEAETSLLAETGSSVLAGSSVVAETGSSVVAQIGSSSVVVGLSIGLGICVFLLGGAAFFGYLLYRVPG